MEDQSSQNHQPVSESNSSDKKISAKKIAGFVVALIVVIIMISFFSKAPESDTSQPLELPKNTDGAVDSEEIVLEYTLGDVAEHSTPEDCWFSIEGVVYDVTGYIESGKHGGGDAILVGCGLDATELFNTRPMGNGTPHSEKARSFLPNFDIGNLVQ